MTLEIIDIAIIVIYFMIIAIIGLKSKTNKSDFFLNGRKLTLPFFVATLVATWYGSILGIAEFTYNNGINAWFCFGLPYYIAAFIYAFFFAEKIRDLEFDNIPDQIAAKFGSKTRLVSNIIIYFTTIPATYILMLGILISNFLHLNLMFSITISGLLSLIIVLKGGFKADVITNTIQFVIMYLGFFLLFAFSVSHFGFSFEIFSKLPSRHLNIFANKSIFYTLAWFVIALQTFVDPAFHQRCAAAKNNKTAKRGILVSIIFWILFDFLTISTGLYAKLFIPSPIPADAYTNLAQFVLPSVAKGVFVVALISVVMSTIESYMLISGITLTNIFNSFPNQNKIINILQKSKTTLTISSLVSILIACVYPSVIDLLFLISSLTLPALLIPMILTYTKKYTISESKVILLMSLTFVLTLIYYYLKNISKFTNFEQYFTVEVLFVGIFLSAFLSIFLVEKTDNTILRND